MTPGRISSISIRKRKRFVDEIRLALDKEAEGFWSKAARLTKPEIRVCRFNNDANLMGALYHYLDMEKEAGENI